MADKEFQLAHNYLEQAWDALGGSKEILDLVEFEGEGTLPSCFAFTDFMAATFAATGAAISELLGAGAGETPDIKVNRIIASEASGVGSKAVGPRPPRARGMGSPSHEYRTADGRWLRAGIFSALSADHLLFPTARKGNMVGLGFSPDQDPAAPEVAEYCLKHNADELEAACLEAGGAAAASRTIDEWFAHPAGKAIADEPIVDIAVSDGPEDKWRPTPGRPLAGIRVLDMTRVLAGPTATRILAGFGAEVLRIDRPGYEIAAKRSGGELMLGKRCASLDLKSKEGRERFLELLSTADVFLHGYRPEALERLGLGPEVCAEARPGLIEVMHDAYGWGGPWKTRRGFEWAVQFSTGISTTAAEWANDPIPTTKHDHGTILDCSTGYLDAASAIRGLTRRLQTGQGSVSKLSLARDAILLLTGGDPGQEFLELPLQFPGDPGPTVYNTYNGPVRRYPFALQVEGSPVAWDYPGDPWGSSAPTWVSDDEVGRYHP